MFKSALILCLILLGRVALSLGGYARQSAYLCGEPEPIQRGSWSIVEEGASVTYECNLGFSMFGVQDIRCIGNGRWSESAPKCVALGCSPLPKFTGRASIRMNGAVVLYKCPKGTWVRGSKAIFCDGTRWNDTVPTCRGRRRPTFLPITNCPVPPGVPDAVQERSFEQVTYRCVNRTVATLGSQILRCLSTGEWDRAPVVCARPGCPRLTEPANGLIIEMHDLSVVEFRCFLHYRLLGSRVLSCNGRQWNGTVPSCIQEALLVPPPKPSSGPGVVEEPIRASYTVEEGTTCGQAPPVRHGRPSYATELDATGATFWSVQYVCERGYRLLRSGRMFCSRSAWIGEMPQCVAYCGVNNGGCSHNCLNTNGRATCTCRSGYRLHINSRSCNDINECASNSGRGPCGEICHNFAGSYICLCQRGYRLDDDGHTCSYQEVDPCSRIRCAYGRCETVNGTATCQCPRGFRLARERRACQDIDECSRQVSPCEQGCRNTFGSYECTCPQGSAVLSGGRCEECGQNTYLSSNGRRCVPCPENAVTRRAGQTALEACKCGAGFEGNPARNQPCRDINECSSNNGGCEQSCDNTMGSFFCKCLPGYTLDVNDQRSCIEIDECSLNNGGCPHGCRNSPGSFSCICNEGYAVDPFDRFNCVDVDECAFDSSRCDQVCVNAIGGYQCECNEGFALAGDGSSCIAEVCTPLSPPSNGYVTRNCSLTEAGSGLPVRTSCRYECNEGYWLDGEAERTCMPKGRWLGDAPRCIQTGCLSLTAPPFGHVIPERCHMGQSEIQSLCNFACDSGYSILGQSTLQCTRHGEWSTRPPICTNDKHIRCPENITVMLPKGSSEMFIDFPPADHNLQQVNTSHPLTGHVFRAGRTRVNFTAYTNDTSIVESCSMVVNVVDEEAPAMIGCPLPFTMKIKDRFIENLVIPEPTFHDNVGVTNVTRTIEPSGQFTWGTYIVHYEAVDSADNVASCIFEITIQALSLDCGVLDGPLNGHNFCNPWEYGQLCQPTCLPGFYFFDGPLPKATYVCGSDAQWKPAKIVPDCTAYELMVNGSAPFPCAAGKQLKIYPALGKPACMECPRGMYSVDLGPITQPVCKHCPRGLYQDRTGQKSCHVCPQGMATSNLGATSPRECQSAVQEAVAEPMP